MKTFEFEAPKSQRMWAFPLLMAFLVSLFLFFIDEGYNSFFWMTRLWNWPIFAVYVVILFLAQVLLVRFMALTDVSKTAKRFISLAGIPFGIMVLYLLFAK